MELALQLAEDYAQKNRFTILYMCVMGSHNWGLESHTSDIDAKLVFIRNDIFDIMYPTKDIQETKDVYRERDIINIDGKEVDIEIEMWSLTKAVELLSRSNPTIIEWVQSSCVLKDIDFKDRMLKIVSKMHNNISLTHHYYNMLTNNLKLHFEKKDKVLKKKYFFVLIPTFYLIQLFRTGSCKIDPIFENLMKSVDIPEKVEQEIKTLIKDKKEGDGHVEIEHIPIIDEWIQGIKTFTESELFSGGKKETFEKKSSIPGIFSKASQSLTELRRFKQDCGSVRKRVLLDGVFELVSVLFLLENTSLSNKDIQKKKIMDIIPSSVPEDIINRIKNIIDNKDIVIDIDDDLMKWYEDSLRDISDKVKTIEKYNQSMIERNRQKHYNNTLENLNESEFRDMLKDITKSRFPFL